MSGEITRLLLDAGNTRIKWALVSGTDWIAGGAIETASPEALEDVWRGLPLVPARLAACNVAGDRVREAVESAAGRFGLTPRWLVSSEAAAGVSNAYDRVTQLGADRWAAALGAWQRCRDACVIVNAGTALTIDALDGSGRFLGGLIVPGVDTMLEALERRTAGLARQPGRYRAFPTNTGDAMWTGAIDAALGAVDRVLARLARQSGRTVAILVSGGGAGALIEQLDPTVARHVEHLVLEGLLAFDTDH